jgi:hypothetical protein
MTRVVATPVSLVGDLMSMFGLWAPPPPAPALPPSLVAQLVSAASSPWVHLAMLTLLVAGMVALLLQRGGRTKKRAPVVKARWSGEALSVFYASQKGHGKRFAERLVVHAHEHGVPATAVDVAGFDTDQLVQHSRAVFIVATYAGGSAVPGTEFFFSELTEMSRDFRVEKTLLAGTSLALALAPPRTRTPTLALTLTSALPHEQARRTPSSAAATRSTRPRTSTPWRAGWTARCV